MCFEAKDSNTVIYNNLVVNSLNCKSDLNTICGPRCIKLEHVKEIKYLAVILDFRLKWDKNKNYINNILRKFFYIFKEGRYIFNNSYKRVIFLTLVQSVYSYCSSICEGTFNNY